MLAGDEEDGQHQGEDGSGYTRILIGAEQLVDKAEEPRPYGTGGNHDGHGKTTYCTYVFSSIEFWPGDDVHHSKEPGGYTVGYEKEETYKGA